MTTWRYIKGSEKDFEGAPEWASIYCEGSNYNVYYEHSDYSGKWQNVEGGGKGFDGLGGFPIIAQRELVSDCLDEHLPYNISVKTSKIFTIVCTVDGVHKTLEIPAKDYVHALVRLGQIYGDRADCVIEILEKM